MKISRKQYHFIYKITNNINGKIYIGKHSTYNLDDGYMGSGLLIVKAIKADGIENFTRDILEFCNNEEEAYKREREIVTEEFCKREDTYNIFEGGKGYTSNKVRELDNKFWAEHPEFKEKMSKRISEMNKKLWNDPNSNFRLNVTKCMKEKWKNPDFSKKVKLKNSECLKNRWKDPKYNKEMIDNAIKACDKMRKIKKELPDDKRKLISLKIGLGQLIRFHKIYNNKFNDIINILNKIEIYDKNYAIAKRKELKID